MNNNKTKKMNFLKKSLLKKILHRACSDLTTPSYFAQKIFTSDCFFSYCSYFIVKFVTCLIILLVFIMTHMIFLMFK